MNDMNIVALIGRLTRDAELKYTNSGMAVCKFAIAVNSRRKNGDQWVEEAHFFDVVLWGKSGEALNQYLVKGKQIAVEGELRQSRWEQDGQSRSRVEIHANNVQLLGGGGTGGMAERGGQPAPRREEAPRQDQAKEKDAPEYFNDDIPF
jgi:single-strand DNA-binding protein